MSDTVSETRACDLLARLFRARGYAVSRNVLFREYGVEFHADGWDPRARVGFEFLSSEDDDHDDLTLEEYKTLMDAQQRGELSLFIIDEVEPVSASALIRDAEEFLDEAAAARRGPARSRRPQTRPQPGRRPAGRATLKKPAKKKPAVKTLAKKKPVVKKSVAKKSARTGVKPAPRKRGRRA